MFFFCYVIRKVLFLNVVEHAKIKQTLLSNRAMHISKFDIDFIDVSRTVFIFNICFILT